MCARRFAFHCHGGRSLLPVLLSVCVLSFPPFQNLAGNGQYLDFTIGLFLSSLELCHVSELMALRHDKRNRCPVRNALLAWQLQADEGRVAEVQHRLMRMATPSPSSSLDMTSRSFDRQSGARRPRSMHEKDRDDGRERDSDKHAIDRFKRSPTFVSPCRAKDNQVLCNTLSYGTKASRVQAKQLSQQLEEHETSGFCENSSRRRSQWQESSVYGDEEDRPTVPLSVDMDDDGMVPSELSTMSICEPAKEQSATQHSDIGAPATDANDFSAPTSGQSIAEMLASMEQSTDVEYSGDCEACDEQYHDVPSDGDRTLFARDESSAIDTLVARVEALFRMKLPWHGTIVIACCFVIGASGFFIEELIALVGLFSRRTRFLLSRAEQERIRDRMSVLQLELQGFQLLTSTIEVRSQTVLSELRQYMDKMRLDREKHQDVLAKEMQKLRRHILHVTHDLVERERATLRIQLDEIIKAQVVNIESADDNGLIVKATDAEYDKQLDKTTTGTPIQVEPDQTMQESLHGAIASSSASACEDNGDQFCLKQTKVEPSHERVTKDDAAVTFVQNPRNVDNEQAQVEFAENDHELVGPPSPSTTGELVNVQHSETKLGSPIFVQEINVEHLVEVEPASLPALEESLNKIDDTVASTSKKTINTMLSHNASGVSWDEILLLIGIVFLAACVVLRAYNSNRRKRWFAERRTRKNRRALHLARRRARAMAEYREDRDEWHGDETDDDIEEVSLMTPVRDNKNDESIQS